MTRSTAAEQSDLMLLDLAHIPKNTSPLGDINIEFKRKIKTNTTEIIMKKYVKIVDKIYDFFLTCPW